jgi:hypothetical protein
MPIAEDLNAAVGVDATLGGVPYTDLNDLKSVRRFFKRHLAPTTDSPFIYIEPLEGEFMRPSVTIRLVNTGPSGTGQAARPTYDVQHQLVISAYGRDRAETMALADKTWRLLMEGGSNGAAFRIPLWEFASGGRLARWLRVDRNSLGFSLEATDDQGLWSRAIEARVASPRSKLVRVTPLMASVTTDDGH